MIFTLLYNDNNFMMSRNFNLQNVGNIDWLKKNYNFTETAKYIDELIILNTSRNKYNFNNFCENVKAISKECFVPIAVGGQIKNIEMIKKLMLSGADKIVMNSAFNDDENLIKEIVNIYGSQCLIASVDYKLMNNNISEVYINNCKTKIKSNLILYLKKIYKYGAGEIYLNSINRDGTGQGYDLGVLNQIDYKINIPIILAGGAGNSKHFYDAIKLDKIHAVATANLFNFVGNGLQKSREFLISKNIKLPLWKY